jgi:hypothetical protein
MDPDLDPGGGEDGGSNPFTMSWHPYQWGGTGTIWDEYEEPGAGGGRMPGNVRDPRSIKPRHIPYRYGDRDWGYLTGEGAAQFERGYQEDIGDSYKDWLYSKYAPSALAQNTAQGPGWGGHHTRFGRELEFGNYDDFGWRHAGNDPELNEVLSLNLESMGMGDRRLLINYDVWKAATGVGIYGDEHQNPKWKEVTDWLNAPEMEPVYNQMIDYFGLTDDAVDMLKNLNESNISHHWNRKQADTHADRLQRFLDDLDPETIETAPDGNKYVPDPSPQFMASFLLPEPIELKFQVWQGPIIHSRWDPRIMNFTGKTHVPPGEPGLWYEDAEGNRVGIIDSVPEDERDQLATSMRGPGGNIPLIWSEDPRQMPEYEQMWTQQSWTSQTIQIPTPQKMYFAHPRCKLEDAIWYAEGFLMAYDSADTSDLLAPGTGGNPGQMPTGLGGGMGGDTGGMGGDPGGGTGGGTGGGIGGGIGGGTGGHGTTIGGGTGGMPGGGIGGGTGGTTGYGGGGTGGIFPGGHGTTIAGGLGGGMGGNTGYGTGQGGADQYDDWGRKMAGLFGYS